VAIAVCVRTLPGWPERRRVRGGALALTAIAPIALILWLPGGPLGHGWARRSGTPVSLLASSAPSSSSPAVQTTSVKASNPSSQSSTQSSTLNSPFNVSLSGSIKQGSGPGPGLVAVKIATSFSGPPAGRLDIEIDGRPVGEGGVSLGSSHVTLHSTSTAAVYRGRIVALNGSRLVARVRSSAGHSLSLQVNLAVNAGAGTVSGTLSASPTASEGGE
jgi:hypothetical protein